MPETATIVIFHDRSIFLKDGKWDDASQSLKFLQQWAQAILPRAQMLDQQLEYTVNTAILHANAYLLRTYNAEFMLEIMPAFCHPSLVDAYHAAVESGAYALLIEL